MQLDPATGPRQPFLHHHAKLTSEMVAIGIMMCRS
jgi:hypothetical protein